MNAQNTTTARPLLSLDADTSAALLSWIGEHGDRWRAKLTTAWVTASAPGPLHALRNRTEDSAAVMALPEDPDEARAALAAPEPEPAEPAADSFRGRVNAGALARALKVAQRVAPRQSQRPALESVHLETAGRGLSIRATDLEVEHVQRLPIEFGGGGGSARINPRTVGAWAATLDADAALDVEMHACRDGGGPHTGSLATPDGADRIEVHGADVDEFPVPMRADGPGFTAGEYALRDAIEAASATVSKKQGRYATHGALLLVEDGGAKLVGTDESRLTLATVEGAEAGDARARAIVPLAALKLALARLDKRPARGGSERAVTVTIETGARTANGIVALDFGEESIRCRSIEGDFPRYSAVIPHETRSTLAASADVLGRSVKRAASVTPKDAPGVKFAPVLAPGDSVEGAQVQGRSTTGGTVRSAIDSATWTDADARTEFALNPDYLADALRVLAVGDRGATVRVGVNDRTSPVRLESDARPGVVVVIMPITIDL